MTLTQNWSRQSGDDRTEEYRSWRTTVGIAGVCDVDQVEYRFMGGELRPVAVVEVCVADGRSNEIPRGVPDGCPPSQNFLLAVEAKVSTDRPQGKTLRLISERLGVPLLLVVFVRGRIRDGFWVHRVGRSGWRHMSQDEYLSRLRRLVPSCNKD